MPFVALSGLNWRSIFRSPTMIHDFDTEVSGIMERFVPMVTMRRRGGDAAWFDGDCRRAFELKQSAYHRWCRNRSAENWDLFCQARGTAKGGNRRWDTVSETRPLSLPASLIYPLTPTLSPPTYDSLLSHGFPVWMGKSGDTSWDTAMMTIEWVGYALLHLLFFIVRFHW